MLTTLRRAVHLIGRGNGLRWTIVLVLALLASGFEILGAALVYVLIGLVADPNGDIELPLLGDVRRLLAGSDQDRILLGMIIVMAVFFLLRGVVQVGNVYVQKRLAHNIGARLAERMFEGYLLWPYARHLNRNSSELIRNTRGAIDSFVGEAIVPSIRVVAESFLLLGFLVLLLSISPIATLIAVLVLGLAATFLLLFIQPRLKRIGRISHQLYGETIRLLIQPLEGLRDVKVLGREHFFARHFGRVRLRLARTQYIRSTIAELPSTVMELSVIGFILVFFAFTIAAGGGTTEAVLPVLGLFAYAGLRLQPALQHIIKGLNSLKFAEVPIADLHADLEVSESLPARPRDVEPLPFERMLVLEQVSFRYPEAERDALSDVDLTIRRGEAIGICGPTGGGKTTLTDLITGLLEPTAGRLLVDDVDLRHHPVEWQQNLGVVPQGVFLIDDTLRRNIALGVDDNEVDEEAVNEAITLAQLEDFVISLPYGLDTKVGERGVRVSGGQRQRIAIARALYRRPAVLIFDEGTSALDNTTESQLMAAIDRLRGERTIIHIAHRLSTVRRTDQVVFIEDGRITAAGTFDDLVRTNETFRTLASAS